MSNAYVDATYVKRDTIANYLVFNVSEYYEPDVFTTVDYTEKPKTPTTRC